MSSGHNKEKNIINVVEDFDYSTQNNAYNEKFKSWRKRKNNSYAFSFKKNKRESVYIDGRGFVDHSCETAEKSTLSNIFYTLGIAMLIWVTFEDFLSKALIKLMNLAGLNIDVNLMNSVKFGGSFEVAVTLILLGIIRVLIPLIYLHRRFKLPRKVEIMRRMNDAASLLGAISAAFLVCIIMSVPAAYSTESKEIVSFFASSNIDTSIWNQSEFMIYTVYDVIVMPVITQVLFCGAAFAVLRQFGDPFAMLITALSAALLTQDLRLMPGIFLITLVGCYGMLSSGTIFTAFAVNIIYRMYDMTITLIETNASENMPFQRNIFMILIGTVGAVGIIFYRIYIKKHHLRLAIYTSELSFGGRTLHAVKTFPYSVVAILCVVSSIMKAVQ